MCEKIDKYLESKQLLENCKSELLGQVNQLKQKIDRIEKGQDEEKQQAVEQFVHRYRVDLRIIMKDIELLNKVCDKLDREVYAKHDSFKLTFRRIIKQQLLRFHHMIPEDALTFIDKSRIRGMNAEANASELKKKEEQAVESEESELLMDLNAFKGKQMSDVERAQQQSSPLRQYREEQQLHKIQQNRSEEQLKERENYQKYIQKQRIKQNRRPLIIVGKAMLVLLAIAIVVLIGLAYVIYLVVSSTLPDL